MSIEFPEHKDSLLQFLDKLHHDLQSLVIATPLSTGGESVENHSKVKEWVAECWDELGAEIAAYTSPKTVAKAILPSSIILGMGTIGALVGGPLWFGAGSFAGQFLVGRTKPRDVAKKIEDALNAREESNSKPSME